MLKKMIFSFLLVLIGACELTASDMVLRPRLELDQWRDMRLAEALAARYLQSKNASEQQSDALINAFTNKERVNNQPTVVANRRGDNAQQQLSAGDSHARANRALERLRDRVPTARYQVDGAISSEHMPGLGYFASPKDCLMQEGAQKVFVYGISELALKAEEVIGLAFKKGVDELKKLGPALIEQQNAIIDKVVTEAKGSLNGVLATPVECIRVMKSVEERIRGRLEQYAQEVNQSIMKPIDSVTQNRECLYEVVSKSLEEAKKDLSQMDRESQCCCRGMLVSADTALRSGNLGEAAQLTSVVLAFLRNQSEYLFTGKERRLDCYGIRPELYVSGENATDQKLLLRLASAFGRGAQEAGSELVQKCTRYAENFVILSEIIGHVRTGSKDLIARRDYLLGKTLRGEVLSDWEQRRLRKIQASLALREAICNCLTLPYIGEKGVEYGVSTLPYYVLQKALGSHFVTYMAVRGGLRIAADMSLITLKNIEELKDLANEGLTSKFAPKMRECLAPVHDSLGKYRQSLVAKAQQAIIDAAYDSLFNGDLHGAAEAASASLLIYEILAQKSEPYLTQADRVLTEMIMKHPQCEKLVTDGLLVVPEIKSYKEILSDFLILRATQLKHQHATQSNRRSFGITNPALLEFMKIGPKATPDTTILMDRENQYSFLAKGALQGAYNIAGEAEQIHDDIAIISQLLKEYVKNPEIALRATLEAVAETGGEMAANHAIERTVEYVWNYTDLGKFFKEFKDHLRQEIGRPIQRDLSSGLIAIGDYVKGTRSSHSVGASQGVIYNAIGELSHRLARIVQNANSKAQLSAAIADFVLSMHSAAARQGHSGLADILFESASLIRSQGGAAAEVCYDIIRYTAESIREEVIAEAITVEVR